MNWIIVVIMLNTGVTSTPFEPYDSAIPCYNDRELVSQMMKFKDDALVVCIGTTVSDYG